MFNLGNLLQMFHITTMWVYSGFCFLFTNFSSIHNFYIYFGLSFQSVSFTQVVLSLNYRDYMLQTAVF